MVIVAAACGVGGFVAVCGLWKCNKLRIERKLAKLVETVAPKALAGSQIDLEQLHLAVGRSTNVALKGLKVHNLEGFLSDSLLTLGQIDVTVNTAKAAVSKGKTIQVKEILIQDCHLTFESQVTTSNVKTLLDKLKAKDSETPPDTKKSDKKVVVNKVNITGVKATVTATAALKTGMTGDVSTIPVPAIVIDDFDGKYGDVSPDKLIQVLIENILNAVLALVEAAGSPLEALNTVENAGGWLGHSVSKLFGFE